MHLKMYSIGLSSAILATGNVSNRGMMPDGNYEAATFLDHLTNEDRIYFERIRNEARLVNDKMYEELIKWREANKVTAPEQIRLEEIISDPNKDDFLISALPMTHSIDDLVSDLLRSRSD